MGAFQESFVKKVITGVLRKWERTDLGIKTTATLMLFLFQCQKDEMRTDQNKIKRLGPFSFLLQKSTVSMTYRDTENKLFKILFLFWRRWDSIANDSQDSLAKLGRQGGEGGQEGTYEVLVVAMVVVMMLVMLTQMKKSPALSQLDSCCIRWAR